MAHAHCMLNTEGYKHARNMQYLMVFHCNNGCTNALHLRYTYCACHIQLHLQHFSVAANYRVLVRLYSPINIYCLTAGVPVVKWQPDSSYCFSIVFPHRLRSYFGCVSSLVVWTQEPRAVHGTAGVREKMIVLELLCSTFSARVGTFAKRNLLILHCTATCWRVHSHHKC